MTLYLKSVCIITFIACSASQAMITNKAAKIAIIGAGPAGIKAATLLRQKGFNHFKIFERRARIGGKVDTATYSDGTLVEHGPIQVGIGHRYTNRIIADLGLKTFEPHNAYILESDHKGGHNILTPAQAYMPITNRLPLMEEAYRFNRIITEFNEKYPNLEDIPPDSDYRLSFAAFTQKYNLPNFHDMYTIYLSAYGYGTSSEVTAFSAMRTFDVSFGMVFWHYYGMNLKMLKHGFSGLLDAMVEHYDLSPHIKLNSYITKIERNNQKIRIHKNRSFEDFDYLVIACPIDKVFSMFDIPTEDEKELYDNLYYSPYHVIIADVPNLPRGGYVIPENFNKPGTLQMISKNSIDGELAILYVPQITPVKASTIIANQETFGSITASIKQSKLDLAALGFDVSEVLNYRKWNEYRPHFIDPTYYGRCKAVQGKNNTFHIGTMCTVSDYVNDAFEHAAKTIDTFFEGPIEEQTLDGVSGIYDWCTRAKIRYSDEQIDRAPHDWSLWCKGFASSFSATEKE